jgi:AAA+ ATPase superfamily predicted ATPase
MDCFGRENETLELWRRFNNGQNILMLAPRRIGKTMLLNHLCESASKQGYRAIVLDVEGFKTEKDFFRQCCAAIQEELSTGTSVMTAFTHRLTRLLQGSDAEGGDWRQWLMHTEWQEFADQLLAHLNDNKEGLPWLILVDELPVFINALNERDGEASIS